MLELFQKKRLVPFLLKLSDNIFHAPRWRQLEAALHSSSNDKTDFFFIQIGANDGITHDRLHKFIVEGSWSGLLVEPIPHYFERLQATYAAYPKLCLENVAIEKQECNREMYRIREGQTHLPAWVNGMASLHLDVLLNHKWAIPDIEDYIVKEQICCVPLEALLRKHSIKHVDLLAIDTEGHDFEVIKQVDFARFRPQVITYEHKHLSRADRRDCESLLRTHNYRISRQLGNTLAVLM